MGFEFVESSPLVRSSFHAEKHVMPGNGKQTADHEAAIREKENSSPADGAISSVRHTAPSARVIYEDLGRKDYKETWDYQELFFNAKVAEKG